MGFYEILGVGRAASPHHINVAAKRKLWQNGANADGCRRIMAAWFIVGDKSKRLDYDYWLLINPSETEGRLAFEHHAAIGQGPM